MSHLEAAGFEEGIGLDPNSQLARVALGKIAWKGDIGLGWRRGRIKPQVERKVEQRTNKLLGMFGPPG